MLYHINIILKEISIIESKVFQHFHHAHTSILYCLKIVYYIVYLLHAHDIF